MLTIVGYVLGIGLSGGAGVALVHRLFTERQVAALRAARRAARAARWQAALAPDAPAMSDAEVGELAVRRRPGGARHRPAAVRVASAR